MERILIIVIAILTLCCSSKHLDNQDKKFDDLNESEKIGVLSQIGEEFKGDYRKYSGQNEDSTTIQLALNKDNRFAIGVKAFFDDKIGNSDSVITFQFATTSEFKNYCIGRWTDEGERIRLNILLGQSDFFDSLKNEGVINVIDDKTVLLDKDAKEVWIWRASCKRQ